MVQDMETLENSVPSTHIDTTKNTFRKQEIHKLSKKLFSWNLKEYPKKYWQKVLVLKSSSILQIPEVVQKPHSSTLFPFIFWPYTWSGNFEDYHLKKYVFEKG